MKTRIALVGFFAGLSLFVALGSARADRLRIGGSFSIHPVGQIKAGVGDTDTVDTETAFSLGGALEYQLHPNFAIGVAPRLILNLKAEDSTESAKEFDLALRLVGGAPVAQNIQIYGFGAPGYSMLFPADWPEELDNPAGFIFGLGGGVGFDINPQFRLAGELGYQFGSQQVSEDGVTLDVNTSFFHLGVVAMALL
jgi:hypothetical protein